MALANYLPFFTSLTGVQQALLTSSVARRTAPAGTLVHGGGQDCTGLMVVTHGRLRAFMLSPEGRELTLFRLLERDICLFSASCMLPSIQFDLFVRTQEETTFYLIPAKTYKQLMEQNAAVANYTSDLMATRMSDIMWLIDQILYKRMDARIAALLLEERTLTGSDTLRITHDEIARHIGTAREVVTRTLKYLHGERLLTLARGSIHITQIKGLEQAAEGSTR